MKKLLKVIAVIVCGCCLLAVGAVVLLPRIVDVEEYKPQIETKLTELTGVPVDLGNSLELSFFPWVGLSITDVVIGNPEGFSNREMVRVGSFQAHLKVLPLLSRQVEVDRILLESPSIYLEKNSKGGANWEAAGSGRAGTKEKEVKGKSGDQSSSGDGSAFQLQSVKVGEIAIRNGSVVIEDKLTQTVQKVSDLTLVLQDVSLDNPVAVDFRAVIDGITLGLNGTFGPLGAEPGKEPIPLDLTFNGMETLNVTIKGVLRDLLTSPAYSFAVDVQSFSPRQVIEKLGRGELIASFGQDVLNSLGVSLEVEGTPQSVTVGEGRVAFDQSQMKFTAQAASFAPLNLTLNGQLDQLDLDKYLPPAPRKEEGGKVEEEEKTVAKTDYGPLRELTVDTKFTVGKLTVHGGHVENIDMQLTGSDGIFLLEPLTLDLYGGSVRAEARVNVQQDEPQTELRVNTQNITVGPLLNDFAGKDILEGVLNSDLMLEVTGDTPEAIRNSITGTGDYMFTDGAIVGVDLAGMVRNIQSAFSGVKAAERPKTDFAELHAPFTLTNGLFNTVGISLKSPFLRVIAKGSADLASETIDMRVHPKFVASMTGQGGVMDRAGIMIPVIVGGTFQKLEFSPDMEELVKNQVVDEGVNKGLDKVMEETGVTDKVMPKEQVDSIKKGIRSLLPKF